MFKIRRHPLWIALFIAAPVLANTDVGDDKTIVVTASRTAQTVDSTLAPVTVFTREDIEKSQAKTLDELLAHVPSIQIVTKGGQGSDTSLFIRGTNSNHVLVLIDGIRSGSATLGTTSIEHIDLEQVERIEIVRGSRSSLYGADAVGGVIQIFTKKGTHANKVQPYIKIGAGSHNATQTAAGVSGGGDKTHYNVSGSYYNTNGYNFTGSKVGTDGDHDMYRNSTHSLSVTHELVPGTEANASYTRTEGKNDYDNAFSTTAPYTKFDLESMSTALKSAINKLWTTTIQLGQYKDDADTRDSSQPSVIDTKRQTISWQNDLSITDNQLLTLGTDYYQDKVHSTNNYVKTSRDNKALFIQDQLALSMADLTLGARHDDNEAYGEHNTGDASLGFNINKELRFIISAGTSFRAPTFNDLYWPYVNTSPTCYYGEATTSCSYVEQGNVNIEPEKAKNVEMELRGNYRPLNWSVGVFQENIKNLIEWANTIDVTGTPPSDVTTSTWMPTNVATARIHGLEATASTNINGWDLSSSTTVLNPRDRDTGYVLPLRAKRTLNTDLQHSISSHVDAGLNWHLESSRYSDTGNTSKLAGYGTANAVTTYHATKEVDVQFKLNNLFDKKYVTNEFFGTQYRQDGVNGFVTVIYKPNL